MITVTENAVKQLHSLLGSPSAKPGADGLRLLVARGGCAGMEYQMKLDSAADGDEVVDLGGVSIYIDQESKPFLDGCEVDYVDDLSDAGFKVNNPNAERSCGCGSSFEPKRAEGEPEPVGADAGTAPGDGSCKG